MVDLFFPEDQPLVGNQVCGTSNWSFEESGDAVSTRLGAFDYAGNFSGWSAPEDIGAGGCGCAVVGADSGPRGGYGVFAAALAALAVLRRRGAPPRGARGTFGRNRATDSAR